MPNDFERHPPEVGSCRISQRKNVISMTDYYLASLAEMHAMRWATLDESIGHKSAFVLPA